MENLSLAELVTAVKGEFLLGDPRSPVNAVSINTRTLRKGDFFFAVKGVNFDGHDFLKAAVEKGCYGLVVSKKDIDIGNPFPAPPAIVYVDDTVRALGDLAAYYRKKLAIRLTGITGSNGKTTTKEMLAAILRKKSPTLSNTGNLNNQIGLPLTLLNMTSEHRYAVIEMGTSFPGEIKRLASIASPDLGIITNIGQTHLEHFQTTENVFLEKRILVDSLPRESTAVLNADDPLLSALAEKLKDKAFTFGINNRADVTVRNVQMWPDKPKFDLVIEGKTVSNVKLPLHGRFNIYNALAAAAAAWKLGASPDEIKDGLASFVIPNMRMNVINLVSGVTLVVDAYNANPTSMHDALNAFIEAYPDKTKILVLGDMLELGKDAANEHQKLGDFINTLPLTQVLFTGTMMAGAHKSVRDHRSRYFENKDDLTRELRSMLIPGVAVFFKASRGMHFEEIVDSLLTEGDNQLR
jgi:UDP-N-acetylmuramoyl-tripeptide--D-alanyl-D-alanine ligase